MVATFASAGSAVGTMEISSGVIPATSGRATSSRITSGVAVTESPLKIQKG